jgi:hypothetical protein
MLEWLTFLHAVSAAALLGGLPLPEAAACKPASSSPSPPSTTTSASARLDEEPREQRATLT